MGRKRSKEAEDRHIELGRQLGKAREAVANPDGGKTGYLTQAAVAKKLGLTKSTVAKMEIGLGTPNPFRLRDLATYYSEPLMPWLRLAYGNELIDLILGAYQDEQSAKNQKSADTTPVATKDNAKSKAKAEKTVKSDTPVHSQGKSAARAAGVRSYQVAGRPRKEHLILVYGEKGPKMTWAQRTAAGVPAEKFQERLAAKQRGDKPDANP